MSSPTKRQRWRDAIRDTDDPDIDAMTLVVAFALDRHMSSDGRTYTGVRTLGALAKVSKNTVTSRVDKLVEAGWLERSSAGRGHRTYYQVSHPMGQSYLTEVSHPVTEVSHPVGQSVPPGGTDPATTPTTPKGGGGVVDGADASGGRPASADATAGAARGSDGRDGYSEWITDVLTELRVDPEEVDIWNLKLVDATTPLLARTPIEIRHALGRQPKAALAGVRSLEGFIASKLRTLHAVPADDPRWKPRPKKAKAPTSGETPTQKGSSPKNPHPVQEMVDAAKEALRQYEIRICGDSDEYQLVVDFDLMLDDHCQWLEDDDNKIDFDRTPKQAIATIEDQCREIHLFLDGHRPNPTYLGATLTDMHRWARENPGTLGPLDQAETF